MDDNFFDAQALRLLKSFFKIHDSDARELIVHLAESAERGASIGGTVNGANIESGAGDGNVIDLPTFRNSFK